ncbi:5'-nucleotidase /3'-nucleotidase /exopolyphosphatase [Caldanaerovirga acetigignens]|uniref:5'-nucleotidase SurE n=1 Tax=Caldanaerovirga acetigignens TaxID=447595 RepID=A0A1M7LAY0_9FIRM|nr:5'/3'-nucleotidase SurE [Caldanaerovirga acetigignens]SHM74998.1 5'-nucleotidase /3'-nucleotidase /exopolyphosphatase [Caldanaerovirga acetigignens]
MNILITNDDGIYAEGLLMLAREISKIAKVTVVAPDRERSATAHAITLHKPLRVEKAELRNCSVESWMVNGTPSDCVKLALDALINDAPDLVLSGINRGPNLGTDVIYSGTVSAAIEAAIYGIPAVAVSVAAYENVSYEYPAQFVRKLCEVLKEKQFPKDTLLNVNIPPLDVEDIAGVLITRLGSRKYKNCFDRRQDPRGKTYFWLTGEVVEDLEDETSDVWAIKNNYISITPIHFDLTNYEVIDSIKKWELKPLL